MAWNTGISYVSSSPVNPALLNGIGNDLRVWGGNVDAGGYSLANLATLTVLNSVTLPNAGSWFKTIGSDSGVDFGFGTTIRRMAADGRMQFDDQNNVFSFTGKVGIGTTAPKAPLHVVGNPSVSPFTNAGALAAGLTAGAFYGDGTGNVRITV